MNTPSNADAEAKIASLEKENADLKAKLEAIEGIIHPRPASDAETPHGVEFVRDDSRLPPPRTFVPRTYKKP